MVAYMITAAQSRQDPASQPMGQMLTSEGLSETDRQTDRASPTQRLGMGEDPWALCPPR